MIITISQKPCEIEHPFFVFQKLKFTYCFIFKDIQRDASRKEILKEICIITKVT